MTNNESACDHNRRATAHVAFAVAGRRIEGDIEVPAGRATLRDLLPALQELTDSIVEVAEQVSVESGAPVSCRKGCGACCRQLVPISFDEAAELRKLVEGMPPARRDMIRSRFHHATDSLESAGLLHKLLHPTEFADDELQPVGLEYFRAGIPCPFLEEESCSIHPDRPLACREYLVTSNPAHCASPSPQTIKLVPMPIKLSRIITRVGVRPDSRFTRWMPLTLAFGPPADPGLEEGEHTGPHLLTQVLERMAGMPSSVPAEIAKVENA